MPIQLTLNTIIHFMAAITSMMIAIILWWYPNLVEGQKKSKQVLSIAFFSLFVWHILYFLNNTSSSPFDFSLFDVFIVFAVSIFMPLNYLYFNTLAKASTLNMQHSVHVVFPLGIFLIALYQYFLPTLWIAEIIIISLHIQMAIYWIMEVNLIQKLRNISKKGFIHINVHWLRWTVAYLVIQTMLFIPFFIFQMFGFYETFFLESITIEAICGLFLSLSLFLRPFLLFGIKDISHKELPSKIKTNPFTYPQTMVGKPKNVNEDAIEVYINSYHPYLKKDCTPSLLAKDLGISIDQLNDYLKRKNGLKFQDYVNLKRIQYSQNIIKEKAYHDMTMDLLAKESGFIDRHSFISSFKKHTGYNPSDYIKHFF
ncbi:helix-turn-helix domain-containing protein [Echinicola sp. 20G]|uniref:helix-turn-helix domain-containing protein n=1 Tax=Echinicola sp. 20G TaxID=2781961 RepID=UPI001F23955A|nr:helix-turn-helix domain-containing protein [Echinicola sp. 20G]